MTGSHKLLSFDATPIHYCRFTPESAPKASLIIVHGMGEHGGRYRRLAQHLLPLGIESFAPDLRGFGHSGGARAYVRSFSDYLKDLEIVHGFVQRQTPKAPVFLMGHSLGGLISCAYAAQAKRPPLKGLVLSSPAFGVAGHIPLWKHFMALAVSRIAPYYSEADRVRVDRLTHDQVVHKEYSEDKLIYHRITVALYREFVGAMKRRDEFAARITLPVLLLQSGDDYVVKKDASLAFYDRLKTADKELEVYPDFYHEIFSEAGREKAFTRMAAWLLSKF